MLKKIGYGLVALVLMALVGCSAMLDAITPAYIPPKNIKYGEIKPTSFLPFTTLWDSQRVGRAVDLKYQIYNIDYRFMKQETQLHEAAARELQVKIIQPAITGLVGSGALAFGWLGMKRPGDEKKPV